MHRVSVPAARLEWLPDGAPRSLDFDDIYFSRAGGVPESRYVYLAGNALPDRWPAHFRNQKNFHLFEAGFGTGLNFLLTVAAFQDARPHLPVDARLHYFAVEMQPLTAADLQRALACFPELAAFANALLAVYPPLLRGWHQLDWPDMGVHLTLVFDTLESTLTALLALHRKQVGDMVVPAGHQQCHALSPCLATSFDAWYLDGFAPAKNSSMWTEQVLQACGALSRPGATASTFSAAGAVRRGLQAAGFQVERAPGFGLKREMIRARFGNADHAESTTANRIDAFAHTITVIGAGIAGAALARRLAERGFSLQVIDRAAAPGGVLREHLGALACPRLTREHSMHSRLQLAGWLLLDRLLRRLDPNNDLHAHGALEQREESESLEWLQAQQWPAELLCELDTAHASQRAGLPLPGRWLWRAQALRVDAAALCSRLLDHPRIECRFGREWSFSGNAQAVSAAPERRIFCTGASARTQFPELPINQVRGQCTLLSANTASSALRLPLRFGGYLLPAQHASGVHVLGSTFERDPLDGELRSRSQQMNLEKLAGVLPDLAASWQDASLAGSAGLRLTSPDRLPLAGWLDPGQAINIAHGSHGLATAFATAALLCAELAGDPPPLPADIVLALKPQRFLAHQSR